MMVIRRRWRGTGLTKRPEIVLGGRETLQYLADQHRPSPFEGQMRRAETWARDVLAKAGHEAKELDYKTLSLIASKADEDGKADSEEDFAARILGLYLKVRAAIKGGDAGEAAIQGVRLGEEINRLETKEQHEATWRTGDKQRRALGSSRANAVARIVKTKLKLPDGIKTIARRLKKPG
jgi:hypothetical protein